jgi:AIPR protein
MVESRVDRITQSLVDKFVLAEQLTHLDASERFERFVNFSVVSGEHSDTFDVEDVSGPGDEVGIDGLAVLVNGALVTTPEQVNELAERNGYVEATFLMVSAKRSAKFAEAEVANVAMAGLDFFGDAKLPRTDFIDDYLEVKDAVYSNGARFSRGLPRLRLFYVTTGRWDSPDVVVRRIEMERERFETLDLFESVEITPLGAKQLRDLYFRTQNPVENEFTLSQKVTLPPIPGVSQAYLGVLPAKEYVRLISDESGQLRKGLFTDNVRDFRGADNPVNASIAQTLQSSARDRFAILNNGVTIVARDLRVTGDKLYMRAYQIVNGGQTSHVLFNEQDAIDESVWIPIRVIGTDDDELTTAVITATNSQTPVAAQELNSRSQFERDLEQFFNTYTGPKALYYERRSRQYSDVTDIEKVRIITRDQLVRAFAAMFLDEPHRSTGYVPALMDELGGRLFSQDHKLEPYYAAAFAHYKLEFFWRNKQLDAKYKPGRWQILMAARHRALGSKLGYLNSREAAEKANRLNQRLWSDADPLKLFKEAIRVVGQAVDGNWKRDHMRNRPTTQDVLRASGA